MKPLPHGYTNHTVGDGTVVVKTYAGPDAAARADREHAALTALTGRVPVPPVLGRDAGTLTVAYVEGAHGQDLIAAGQAWPVLAACGQVLRDIHRAGWAHGDFGPNNVLLDPGSFAVTAVLDWEFASHPLGDPVPDLAWCEWIVRTHHADHHPALDAFFAAYGHCPPWPARQRAMVARCRELLDFVRRWDPAGPGVKLWRQRLATTAAWPEA
jgi:aminoglycoside phosphotransferase (APT) family kinase protein